jgi:hypothetical protein
VEDMKKTRVAFGLEFKADDCVALRLAIRELLWRCVDYGAFSACLIFCAGRHCGGMSVEVRGRCGGALRRIAGLVWL